MHFSAHGCPMKRLKACWNYEMKKVVLDFSKRQVTGYNVCSSLNTSRIIWRKQNKNWNPQNMTPYIIYFIAKFTNLSCTPYYLLHRLPHNRFWSPAVRTKSSLSKLSKWYQLICVLYQLTHVYFAVSYHKTETYICSFSFDSPQPFLAMDTNGLFPGLIVVMDHTKPEIGTGKTGQGWLLRKRLNEYEPECCENRKVSRQVALNVKALYSLLFFAYALAIIRPSRDLILEKKHSVTKKMND